MDPGYLLLQLFLSLVFIDDQVGGRLAHKMEDKAIAPNTYIHTADPIGMGRKSHQYNIYQYGVGTGATFCPYPTGLAVR